MGWQLAIDVGNTSTVAASVRDGGEPRALDLGDGQPGLASVVYIGPSGERIVGADARARGIESPERIASGLERSLVTGVPVLLAGQRHDPAELMATIAAAVYRVACSREGSAPDHVTITHRAGAPTAATDRLLAAASYALPAGPTVSLLADVEAAAAHAATVTHFEPGDAIAVYDFGGGGLSVCILRHTPFGFEVVGRPGGAADIGGVDIDAALCALVVGKMPGAADMFSVGDESARRQEAALRESCTDAKIRLSDVDTTPVSADVGGAAITVDVTRHELAEAAEPVVARSVQRLTECIASAHIEAWELQGLLALGGVSHMTSVRAAVSRAAETEPLSGIEPKLAVALGAAAIGPARFAADEARRYADAQAQRFGPPKSGGPPAPTAPPRPPAVAPATAVAVAPAPVVSRPEPPVAAPVAAAPAAAASAAGSLVVAERPAPVPAPVARVTPAPAPIARPAPAPIARPAPAPAAPAPVEPAVAPIARPPAPPAPPAPVEPPVVAAAVAAPIAEPIAEPEPVVNPPTVLGAALVVEDLVPVAEPAPVCEPIEELAPADGTEVEPEPELEPEPTLPERPPLTIPRSAPSVRPIVFVGAAVVAGLLFALLVVHRGGGTPSAGSASGSTSGSPTTPTTAAPPSTLDAVTVAARAATSLLTVSDYPTGFNVPVTPWLAATGLPPCAASTGAGDVDVDHPSLALTGRSVESAAANASVVEEIRVYGSTSAAHTAFAETAKGLSCTEGDISGVTVPIGSAVDVSGTVGGDEAQQWTIGGTSTFIAVRTGTALVTFAVSPLHGDSGVTLDTLGIVAQGVQRAAE